MPRLLFLCLAIMGRGRTLYDSGESLEAEGNYTYKCCADWPLLIQVIIKTYTLQERCYLSKSEKRYCDGGNSGGIWIFNKTQNPVLDGLEADNSSPCRPPTQGISIVLIPFAL